MPRKTKKRVGAVEFPRNSTAAILQAPSGCRPARCGPLTLWHRTRRAEWLSRDLGLTLTEYSVVSLLAANAGQPVTYRAIYGTMHYPRVLGGLRRGGL